MEYRVDMDLEYTGLSKRARRALAGAGIITVEQLTDRWVMNPQEVECIHGVGPGTFLEIANFIERVETAATRNPQRDVSSLVNICRHCRQPLTREKWNTRGDMLYCDNLSCLSYRQPQGFITVPGRLSMEEVLG